MGTKEGEEVPISNRPSGSSSGSENTSSEPVSSTAANFFRLPIEIRRIIYKLVLSLRQPLYLFRNGARVQSFAPEIPRRWRALLRANRQIHSEASAVVYGSIHFTLMDATQQVDLLRIFLNTIGPQNAGFLSWISMSFPVVEVIDDQPGKARLGGESLQGLGLLQERCTGLTTLEAMVRKQKACGLSTENQDNANFIEDAFSLIDEHLRAVRSLNKFIVRVYDGTLASSVVESMQRLGWVVYLGDEKKPL